MLTLTEHYVSEDEPDSGSGGLTDLAPTGKVVLTRTFTVTATRTEMQTPAASTGAAQRAQQLENLRGTAQVMDEGLTRSDIP